MKKNIFLIISMLAALCSIYAEKVGTITEVVNPFQLVVEESQMYISEGPVIYIYSLEDLRLRKKFGKAGEGPGEFKVHPGIYMGAVMLNLAPEYILVNSVGRLSFFTKDGEYVKEMISPKTIFGAFQSLGDKFVGNGRTVEQEKKPYRTIEIYNSTLDKSEEFYRFNLFYSIEQQYINLLEAFGPFFYICENKIFIEKNKDSISVFDNKGKFLYSIDVNKGYKKPEFTGEDKKKFIDFVQSEPAFKKLIELVIKKSPEFPGNYPGIRFFNVEDKKIYVIRWKEKNGKSDIWVFDLKGNFLKRAWVKFFEKNPIIPYAYSIHKGKLYQLVEDKENEEQWNLYVSEIK